MFQTCLLASTVLAPGGHKMSNTSSLRHNVNEEDQMQPPVVRIKESFEGCKRWRWWHHVPKPSLVSEALANEWTLFTEAAFAALLCYFWLFFLIMSQHKFGYIILMYSGVLASVRLVKHVWLFQITNIIGGLSPPPCSLQDECGISSAHAAS